MLKLVKKKLNKKQSQRIKTLVLAIGLLICCCLVFSLLFVVNIFNDKMYKVESRVKEIKQEQRQEKKVTDYGTIAWLRVQGTNIDTPVIGYKQQSVINEIDKDDFLWNNINKEKFYNQISISGHNILNLSADPLIGEKYFSRFEDLMAFVHYEFIEENKYIQYTVDGKDYVYKIFGVFFEKDYKLDLYHEGNYTKKEAKEYLKKIEELNIYDFDVEVDENDSFITLTTCTRFFGYDNKKQFVVVGRLLRDNEKINNYDVSKNKNYELIEQTMKGDEENAQA